MQWPLIENQVRLQYRLLNHEGFYSRVRASHEEKGKQEKYLFGIEEILRWARPRSGLGNLYISRNPFTQTGKVAEITGFTIDIDPVREPKDRASTPDEYKRSYLLARSIRGAICQNSVTATSGNGALLLLPFESPITEALEEFSEKAQEFEAQIIKRFSTSEVRIDATNYAKALVRLMGSPNVKDANRAKWRYARFIGRPVFRAKRPGIFDVIKGINVPQSMVIPELACATSNTNGAEVSSSSVESIRPAIRLGPAARLDLAEKSLGRIKRERADNYDDWLKCGIALKEFGPAGFQLWKTWSDECHTKDRERFSTDGMLEKWASFGADQSLTVGTLKYWADADSGVSNVRLPGLSVLGADTPKLWTPGQSRTATQKDDEGRRAIDTGYVWLNTKFNGGYRPGVVYVIHGVTNSGKSTFLIQAVRHVCESGKRVLFISTEANEQEIQERYLASGTGLSASQISNGGLDENGVRQLAAYQDSFRNHPLWVHYTTSPKTGLVEQYIQEVKPDFIAWDYFQHFETTDNMRYNQLAEYARWFESVAIKYQVPLLVGSQLHLRPDFKTGKKQPASMTHVKDCPVINDAAKVVMVLDWDTLKDNDGDGAVNVRLSINKNKGPMGETRLLLVRSIPRLEEI